MRFAAVVIGVAAGLASAAETCPFDPRADFLPGFSVSCRAKVGALKDAAWANVLSRAYETPGGYFLRVDPASEGRHFSFFANIGGSLEPRVRSLAPVEPNREYGLAAGWDGKRLFLAVDGVTNYVARSGAGVRMTATCFLGSAAVAVRDVRFRGVSQPDDPTAIGPGFRLGCTVTFPKMPSPGLHELVSKSGEFLLRYDLGASGDGSFRFWPWINGGWEPSVGLATRVEAGKAYEIAVSWDGTREIIGVNGVTKGNDRFGTYQATNTPTRTASSVKNLVICRAPEPNAFFTAVESGELMPYIGEPMTIKAEVYNVGNTLRNGRIVAITQRGSTIEPAERQIPDVAEGAAVPFVWRLDPGTNNSPWARLELWSGKRKLSARHIELVQMPKRIPDISAAKWNPPIRETRAYHVDSRFGDDSRDGLTPETAWKSFANVQGRTLGPGERLLLRRGSVFNEELVVTAKGASGNWAEIGAYGEGPRPTIRRTRDIDDRCAFVLSPSHLAIRDLIVCDAGKGLIVECGDSSSGYVLMERCLAHHIEGLYRFNSHGIPEWRDKRGAPGGAQGGLVLAGQWAHHMFMRDCEMYQCSNGFHGLGSYIWFGRIFCHDNYCRNTSPHPFFTATRRAWIVDSIFDGAGWNASCGTMGIMLGHNDGLIVRGCHFVNVAESGSGDGGGIDFECWGNNCLLEGCTFRNNVGAAIEVLGFSTEQAHNTHVRNCRFDRNNWAKKSCLGEIVVDGGTAKNPSRLDRRIWNSSGFVERNGYVLAPGICFFTNRSELTQANWRFDKNRRYPDWESLKRAMPLGEPPEISACREVWTDAPEATLAATVGSERSDPAVAWEQTEGPAIASFATPDRRRTTVSLPRAGDYRFLVKADDGRYWRTARTAVHRLEPGWRAVRGWDFSRNLDAEGWSFDGLGTTEEKFYTPYTVSLPVHDVVGDYFVMAVKDAKSASLTSPDGLAVGGDSVVELRIRMQNHTDSSRMRVLMLTDGASDWAAAKAVEFAVNPSEVGDTVYRVPLAFDGALRQLRIEFSVGGVPIVGTLRIDYITLVKKRKK